MSDSGEPSTSESYVTETDIEPSGDANCVMMMRMDRRESKCKHVVNTHLTTEFPNNDKISCPNNLF